MSIETVGWDIGGAHIKLAAMNSEGRIVRVIQRACPLWKGLDQLTRTLTEVAGEFPLGAVRVHAVTMTGELADVFPHRRDGVVALVETLRGCFNSRLLVFAGPRGLLEPADIRTEDLDLIASANWLASAMFAAKQCEQGLLIDVGSTTTDLIAFANGEVHARGYTDYERLRYDELLYLGILRTPVMAIAERAPFGGYWVALMKEHFATSADIFRLSGELPEHADQYPPADGGEKDRAGSARRLARMIGRDLESATADAWNGLANHFRECQIALISRSVALQLSRPALTGAAPLIGAGIGRFLVQVIARRLGRPYIDVMDLCPVLSAEMPFSIADCLPAAAVAHIARYRPWSE